MQNKAVVVGALGVIGRYIAERLIEEADWQVVGLSRRKSSDGQRYRHIAVDLLDAEDTKHKLAGLTDVTHIFYAAFQATPGSASNFASNTGPNRDMLVNSVTAITRVAPRLKRVVLVTGTKYYGVHLGPLKTPMRETDPRHTPPNYYFDQIDWLTDFQRGKAWDWVELRPQTLCGFSPGSAMSILPAIAVYAAISKELGLPLRFPGKPGAYDTIYQVTESAHFANAAWWAATDQRNGNQAFNITNGDYFRWRNLWPRIAEVFQMSRCRSANNVSHAAYGRQGSTLGGNDRKVQAQANPLLGSRRLAICGLCFWRGLGRNVGRNQVSTLRLPRCGR